MKQLIVAAFSFSLTLAGCSQANTDSPEPATPKNEQSQPLIAEGKWIIDTNGAVMLDPQTSGLDMWRGQLVTIADASAHDSQQHRIHLIDPESATLTPQAIELSLSPKVRRGCFSDYLSGDPDLEALVVDPRDDKVFYTVTEDATRTGSLSNRCQQKYANSGSTDYPTLLLRVEYKDATNATVTHVRPIQYAREHAVGNFPNDGIEGLAMTPEGTLYLGLEKDAEGKARIFSLELKESFWDTDNYAKVIDPELNLPPYFGGNHPINGLTYYVSPQTNKPYLLAAARNDNELWVVDITKQTASKRIVMQFSAPTASTSDCAPSIIMDNASIEGLAVIGETLWLVNDPWKRNYMKNVLCTADTARYEAMAPLLFSVPIDPNWFE